MVKNLKESGSYLAEEEKASAAGVNAQVQVLLLIGPEPDLSANQEQRSYRTNKSFIHEFIYSFIGQNSSH